MDDEKELIWKGSAFRDLCGFPKPVLREAGYELRKVQCGFDPSDWKPLDDLGPGTREIRLRDAHGIYRVMYVAKFAEAIYVLHCFEKKTQTTSRQDKETATLRYRAVIQERKESK